MAAAAFIPRPKSGFWPTSWTFFAVPGVVAFNSPVLASTIQIAASTTVNRDFILTSDWMVFSSQAWREEAAATVGANHFSDNNGRQRLQPGFPYWTPSGRHSTPICFLLCQSGATSHQVVPHSLCNGNRPSRRVERQLKGWFCFLPTRSRPPQSSLWYEAS